MSMDAADDLAPEAGRAGSRLVGVAVGVVTNNTDPQGLGRVKVRFPWLSDSHESNWARVVTPMAGKARGFYFLPEIDDEVLVAFEHGRIDYPFVLGSLWNGQDQPLASNAKGEGRLCIMKSRSGHTVTLDDTDGKEKITIADGKGVNQIVLDAAASSLVVKSEGSLTVEAKGALTLKSTGGDVAISGNKVSIHGQAYEIHATQQGKVSASVGLSINGALPGGVNINDGALKVT
jgi:uncharacterized protein involved in type VI secretion and phage assembly